MRTSLRLLAALGLLAMGAPCLAAAPGNAIAVAEQYPAFCLPEPAVDTEFRVRVSPDGQHVYVLGEFISVWERQPNGALALVEEDQTVAFPAGLSGNLPRFVLSPDGGHMYLVFNDTVRVYARDALTGEVSLAETVAGVGTAKSVVVSPDGANVYVSAKNASGGNVVVFDRDPVTGSLTHLETETNGVGGVIGLDDVSDLVVVPGGEHLYVGAFEDIAVNPGFPGNVVVGRFDRDPVSGLLTFAGTTVVRSSVGSSSGGILALRASPDGLSLYVSSGFLGTSDPELQSLLRDPLTGDLTLVGTPLGIGPPDLEFAPGGDQAYWGGGARLDRDPVTGVLSPVPGGGGFTNGAHLKDDFAIAPDGLSVHVLQANFNGFPGYDQIVSYARDLPSGDLSPVQGLQSGQAWPETLTISPDEEHLYATCRTPRQGDTVVVLDRNPATGAAAPVGAIRHALDTPDGLRLPSSIVASADGQNVYVVARTNDGLCGVTTLDRDGVSGLLSWADTAVIPGTGTSPSERCLAGALVEGPDGGNVYVVARAFDGMSIVAQLFNYERDPVLGTLTFVEAVLLPVFGSGLALASDGSRLVVGTDTGSLVSVGRDLVDGSLGTSISTFIESGELLSPVFASNGDFWVVSDFPAALWSLDYDPTTGVSDVLFKEARTSGNLRKVVLDETSGHLLGLVGGDVVAFRRDASGAAFLGDVIDAGPSPLTDAVLAASGPETYVTIRHGTTQLSRVVRVPACATAPMVGCRTSTEPGAGLVFAKRPGNPARSKLKWKLIRGEAALPADFGDPATTTGQVLCVYDASGSGDAVVAAEVRPGGTCGSRPCWKTTSTGFIYKASLPDRQPDGVAKMTLKAGPAGKSSIKVIVAGGALGLPTTAFVPPVVVQLQDTNGSCWEATVSAPAINEPGKFKGKAD